MDEQPSKEGKIRPDSWWYRVYFLVLVWTVVVISAFWYLSYYFSKPPTN